MNARWYLWASRIGGRLPAAARDTLVLSAGLGAAQLLLWAALPLWSRLYGPTAFAALGLWTAVVSVVSMLLLLRYDTAVVVTRSDAEARALVHLCLRLACGGGLLLSLAAWALPAHWLAAAGLDALGGWLPLAVLAGALAACTAALLAWANRRRDFARMSGARLAAAVAAVAAGSGLGWAGVGGGLLLAQLVAAAAPLALLGGRGGGHSSVRAAARAHAAAPRLLWPAAMLDTLTQQLPLWLTVLWFSVDAAGQFSLAWRVTALPVLMLATAVGSVFYQRFAVACAHDAAAARRLLLRTWRVMAGAGLLPALLLAAFGEPLFAALFGAAWRPAGQMAALLAPMLWAMLVSSPTSGALIVLGLHKWSPVFGLAMLAYRPAAFALGASQGSLLVGLAAWAVCEVAVIVLYNRLLLNKLLQLRRLQHG